MRLGVLGASGSAQPTESETRPSPYPPKAGRHRPWDTYPYYRWSPPVPFAAARFGPPPPAGLGAYYETRYEQPVTAVGAYYETRYEQPIMAVGQLCPSCSFWDGARCVPCPEGSELPECEGCEDGMPESVETSFWERSSFWSPVIVGTVTTIVGAFALAYLMKGQG